MAVLLFLFRSSYRNTLVTRTNSSSSAYCDSRTHDEFIIGKRSYSSLS